MQAQASTWSTILASLVGSRQLWSQITVGQAMGTWHIIYSSILGGGGTSWHDTHYFTGCILEGIATRQLHCPAGYWLFCGWDIGLKVMTVGRYQGVMYQRQLHALAVNYRLEEGGCARRRWSEGGGACPNRCWAPSKLQPRCQVLKMRGTGSH